MISIRVIYDENADENMDNKMEMQESNPGQDIVLYMGEQTAILKFSQIPQYWMRSEEHVRTIWKLHMNHCIPQDFANVLIRSMTARSIMMLDYDDWFAALNDCDECGFYMRCGSMKQLCTLKPEPFNPRLCLIEGNINIMQANEIYNRLFCGRGQMGIIYDDEHYADNAFRVSWVEAENQ